MKKLMTMLAAAAMAFGLYADGAYEQKESFEDGFTVGELWSTNAEDTATVEVKTYVEGDEPTHVPDAFTDGVGTKYLAVKTELKADGTKGLSYAFDDKDTKEIGEGVYFDGLVNFTTACDDTNVDVTVDEDGSCAVKLVAYAVDMGEIEGGTAGQTNLFITAGYYNDGTWEAKAYNCGQLEFYDLDASGFYRLTIRAMRTIGATDTVPGFVVFVNGRPAQRLDSADVIGYTDLNATAAYWNSKKNLFPSLNQSEGSGDMDVIAGVTVAGQGLIDCFALTRNCPQCAKDKSFTLTKDEHIESFKYTVGGVTSDEITDDSIDIPLTGAAMTVTISDIVYEKDEYIEWGEGTWTTETPAYVTPNAATLTFTIDAAAENCNGKLVSKDVAQRIQIGDKFYPTFTEAIAAIGSDPVTLTINKPIKVEKSGSVSEVSFPAGSDVTIDLNGQTITGTAFSGYVLVSAGKLTIIDGKPEGTDGKVVAVDGNAGAVIAVNLAVTGGIFDGKVEATTSSSIAGGSFLASANAEPGSEDEGALTLATGFKAEEQSGYWVVSAKEQYEVTIDATHATVTVMNGDVEVKTGDKVYADTVLTITAAKVDNYDEPSLAVNGGTFESGSTHKVAGAVEIVATATATEKTITYTDYPDATETYSVESYPTALYVPTDIDEGYEFKGWEKDGEPFTLEDLKALDPVEDVTLTADIEAITYTITYVGGDGATGEMEPETFTLDDGSYALTANAFEKEGFEFVGWKDQDGNEYADEEEIDPLPAKNLTLTAQWKSEGPVIPEPEDLPEDEKTAYNDWYTKNPADPGDTALNDPEDLKDAYLLGCKAGEEALEAARKEFKFASIEFVDDEWVVTIDKSYGDANKFYGNGKIKMGRYSDVECKTPADDGNFFKAELDYKSAE